MLLTVAVATERNHTVTDPTRRTTRPATDGPVMGDHPELEDDDIQRVEPVRDDDDGRSPLLIAGIVALVIVVIVILVLVF